MADLIVNNDLTTVSLTGSGVFDLLMQTAVLHLKREMQEGRITGASYTQAYMAAMQYAMQNAVQFVTSSKQINGQLHLLEQQTLTEVVNTSLTTKRVAQTESATLLQNQQTLTETQNTHLVEQKVVTEKAQTADEIDTVPVAGVVKAQTDQIRSATAQNNASTALIEQKRITEAGQTTNNTAGILGAQQQLYIAQKEGFEFDKVYKFASKLSDVWISRLSLDTVSDIGAAGMGDASILAAINELRSAVGLAHIAG